MADNIFDIAPSPQRMPIRSTTEGAASIPDVATASLIQDPRSRIQYYSEQMDIPMSRFGIADGDIVYQTDRGDLQRVSPGVLRGIAKGVGPTFPAVGGAVGAIGGGLLGAMAGGVGAVPGLATGGVLGASGGQAIRENIASLIADQPVSYGRIATEGAIDLAGTLAGALIGKGVSRVAATKAAKDFSVAMKTSAGDVARSLSSTLEQLNRQMGTRITLTPAELTGDAGLIGVQKALQGDPRTAETMVQAGQDRAEQIAIAAAKTFQQVAPSAPMPEATGRELATAAGEAVKALGKQRAAIAGPAYKRIEDAPISLTASVVSKETGQAVKPFDVLLSQAINDFPRFSGELRRLRGLYTVKSTNEAGETVVTPRADMDLKFVQNNLKEGLDDLIGAALRSGSNKKAMKLQELQGQLLLSMDAQVPAYAAARKAWGDLSKPIDEVVGGVLPALANKNIKDFEYMGQKFLTSSSPAAIKQAKENITMIEGGQDVWDATVRGALEGIWEGANKIPMSYISRPELVATVAPARFWAAVAGDPKQKKRLESALSEKQLLALNNLVSVMGAASRAMYTGSDTAAKESAKDLLEASNAAGTAMKYALAPYRILGAMSDAAGRKISDANAKKLAEVITRGDSVEELIKIRAGQGGKFFNTVNMAHVGAALARLGSVAVEYRDLPQIDVGSIRGDAQSLTSGTGNIFD